ncbi:LysM repeat protein [Leifsonia sp. AK011]|uniref:LysM peptidoglycan-binding domain-containing protein n=1 Tax=Leifsonia sp. AK011 TaxID=2723075 RepID=UPI0015CCBF2C|nr:LysM peptidoglycan-binding domain-containing protein [Leifsonia sp. AK011]NYF10590.1 LysM repeat protein [Leifsonia sp. AK011]
MTETAGHDAQLVARRVFDGLAGEPATPLVSPSRARLAQTARQTMPILLAGSMAAMTLNLTGPLLPADAPDTARDNALARKDLGARGSFGQAERETVTEAVADAAPAPDAAASAPASVSTPPTYAVEPGDTISDIAGRFGLATASVLALNGLSWSSLIFPGQVLKLTNGAPLPEPVAAEVAPQHDRYTIAAGDTISAIADRFGITAAAILTANGLSWSSIIYPGQTLAIPVAYSADGSEAVVDEAPLPSAPVTDAPVTEVSVDPVAPDPTAVGGRYTVVAGDTISGIAARQGVDVQSLLAANGLSLDSLIFTGDELIIPGISTASVSETTTSSTDESRTYAAVIVQVGRELGVSDYGIVIALATAMQESTLRNLDWGDRDSVGLFQQRPSSGWGTPQQLMTPSYAARLFYGGPSNPNAGFTRGLLDIDGWESMPLTVAAQAVQISGHPDAYAKWESAAWSLLAELS